MIVTDPVSTLSGMRIEDYSTPMVDFLSDTAAEHWVRNPIPSLYRDGIRRLLGEGYLLQGPAAPAALFMDDVPEWMKLRVIPEEKLSRMVSPDEANERGKEYGLKFKKPIREYILNDMMELKKAELDRQVTFAQAENQRTYGLGTMTGLLVSALDPLNVASAFIPVVGEARFAALAGRVGLTGARATRGVTEGIVGAAAVEPFVLGVAQQEQADYGLYDSLLNVAFGSVLGGGLHVLGGRLRDMAIGRPELTPIADRAASTLDESPSARPTNSDRLATLSHDTREAALRMALTDLQTFGTVRHVDPILASDPDFRAFSAWETASSQTALTRGLGDAPEFRFEPHMVPRDAYEAMQTATMRVSPERTSVPYVARNGKRPSFETREKAERAAERILREKGIDVEIKEKDGKFELNRPLTADFLRDATGKPLTFDAERFAKREVDRILNKDPTLRAEPVKVGDRWMIAKDADADEIKLLRKGDVTPAKSRPEAVERAQELVQADHRASVEDALSRGQEVPERVLKDYPDLEAYARQNELVATRVEPDIRPIARQVRHDVENKTHALADPEGARLVDEELKADPEDVDGLIADEQARQQVLRDMGIEDAANDPEVKAASEALTQAEQHVEAVRAAAVCQMGRAA